LETGVVIPAKAGVRSILPTSAEVYLGLFFDKSKKIIFEPLPAIDQITQTIHRIERGQAGVNVWKQGNIYACF